MNNFPKNTSENVKLSDNFTNDFIAWVVLIPHYFAVYGIKTTPTDFNYFLLCRKWLTIRSNYFLLCRKWLTIRSNYFLLCRKWLTIRSNNFQIFPEMDGYKVSRGFCARSYNQPPCTFNFENVVKPLILPITLVKRSV